MSLLRVLTAALSISVLASAADAAPPRGDYLTGYAGWYDLLDQEDEAAQVGVEYRWRPVYYGLRPTLGVNVSTDSSIYAYGGFNWEYEAIPQWFVIPNFMVGHYAKGEGKSLGGPIEFRSGLEVAYQLPGLERIGVAFNHISNAGIYKRNPGAEALLVTVSLPF